MKSNLYSEIDGIFENLTQFKINKNLIPVVTKKILKNILNVL